MNARKTVVIVAVIIIALMGLFPPWKGERDVTNPFASVSPIFQEVTAGYAFIMTPPSDDARIDFVRLLIQWAVVAVLAWGVAYALEPKRTLKP